MQDKLILINAIHKAVQHSILDEFLTDILTPAEIDQVVERCKIIDSLRKNKTQREIAKELQVSIATVTRGSKEIKYGAGSLKKIFPLK
jgi:TrpR family trp operon transcriptional repressor